jgi:hypothetical protein
LHGYFNHHAEVAYRSLKGPSSAIKK